MKLTKRERMATTMFVALAGVVLPRLAQAHITVASGPGTANTTQEVSFGVAHGCSGTDTASVRLEIPAGVTSVRPMASDFGKPTVETDATGAVTAVVWTKADADVLASDIAYYKLVVRMKVPDKAFTTIYFPAHQTCRGSDGGTTVVDWIGLPTTPATDAAAPEPAPALVIVPAHKTGWNKLVAPIAVTDLVTYFGDAQIVWKGTAAFSANTTTTDLIKTTSGVTALSSISANDELWVRY
jgi:uncharacterized protein YcnI